MDGATVKFYPMSIAPHSDVTALIPLDTLRAVNDLWTEVTECPIRLEFGATDSSQLAPEPCFTRGTRRP